MTNAKLTLWQNAQLLERQYHITATALCRREEQHKRSLYAALLGINAASVKDKLVLDVAAGPSGLLLSFADLIKEGSVALDPLTFGDEDEERYVAAGVTRVYEKIEKYPGNAQFDEVWVYNGLQHVECISASLENIRQHARRAVRIFEYLHVPVDQLHLHELTVDRIRSGLKGLNPAREIIGDMRISGMSTQFYAALYLHRSEDAKQWV